MKKLWILLTIFLATAARADLGPTCALSGTLQHIYGTAAANARVFYQYGQAQNPGGAIIPGGDSCSVKTDSNGDLPTSGTCTSFTQGAYVFVTVGSGQPIKIQIPLMTAADLSTLILANMDPPSLISSIIALGPCAPVVTNPTNGSIGSATLTFQVCQAVFPSATAGQFFMQGTSGSAVAATMSGDISCSTTTPGLCTDVGIQGVQVSNTAPTDGQTLVYSLLDNKYEPSSSGTTLHLTSNTIEPANADGTTPPTDGTASIGGFNGSRSGEKNLTAFGAVGAEPWALETPSCTSNGSNILTCAGIASAHFAVGQHVAFFKGAASPTAVSTPSLTITPMVTGASYSNRDGIYTSFNTGCVAFNPICWGTSGSASIRCSNTQTYENGNSISIAGNSYTVLSGYSDGTDGFLTLTAPLSTSLTGRDLSDGVTNTDTSLVSATASFTSADIGRPVLIYTATPPTGTLLSAAGTVISSVSSGTTVVLNHATIGTATGAVVYLGSEPVTGANCTTHRSYEAAFVYSNGAYGPLSACTTKTTTANALNIYNVTQVQSPWDTNAVAMAVYGKEGDNCSGATLQGFEIPTYTYNQEAHTGANLYLNDPWLPTSLSNGAPKQRPTKAVFHDYGRPYGNDVAWGASPATAGQGIVTTTITNMSGTSVTLNTTVANSVSSFLMHDDGPALNAAATAAYDAPNYTGVYAPGPSANYPIVTQPSFSAGGGFHLFGDSAVGNDATYGASRLVWYGPLGGVMLPLIRQDKAEVDHVFLDSGTTMGVCVDHDGPNISGDPSTKSHFHDMACGLANTVFRMANINTGNVEFDKIDMVFAGFGGFDTRNSIHGEYGIIWNSSNSLGQTVDTSTIYGELGAFAITGQNLNDVDFPAIGGVPIWAGQYFSTPMVMANSRQEHISRAFFSPLLGGSLAGPQLTMSSNIFVASQYTPDCAFFGVSGAGTFKLDQNLMDGINHFVGRDQDANYCASGFIVMSEGLASSGLNSQGNRYDNISTPFSNMTPQTIVSSITDWYRGPSNGNYVAVTITTSPTTPTSLAYSSTTPTTLLTSTNHVLQGGAGSIATSGGSLTWPQQTAANMGGVFTLIVNNQLYCTFQVAGSTEVNVLNARNLLNTTDTCTKTSGTGNAFNLSFSGTSLVLENNSASYGNPSPIWWNFCNHCGN